MERRFSNIRSQTMSRDEVMAKLGEFGYLNTRHKEIEPDARTAILAGHDGELGFRSHSGTKLMEMPQEGIDSLSKFLAIPWPIGEDNAKGITPNTFATLATDRLGRAKKFTFVTRDNKIVGWTVTKEPIMEPEKVIENALKVIPDATFDNLFDLGGFKVVMDVCSPIDKPIAVGELARGGATVLFSPYGSTAPEVQSYVKQLLCLNGNTTDDVLRRYEYTGAGGGGGNNGGGGYWNWLKNSLKKAADSVEGIVTRWRGLKDEIIPPEERSHIIAGIIKDAKLSNEVADAIWAHVTDEPIETAYDAMGLITWAASHVMTDPRQILRARGFAEQFSRRTSRSRACPYCHRDEGGTSLVVPPQAG